MKDTIYRQAAIKGIHKAIFEFFDICDDDEESPMTYQDKRLLELNKAITTRIKALPSAQPERKKGKWIEHNPHKWGLGIKYECSECGYEMDCEEPNFCPNCGADMRGEKDG